MRWLPVVVLTDLARRSERSQGYEQNTMGFKPMGWTAEAGKTYRVTIAGLTGGNVVYDVKSVTCN